MNIKCPCCQTEYDLEPGKYECECGGKFFVQSDGSVFPADSDTTAEDYPTDRSDLDRTVAPLQGKHFNGKDDLEKTQVGRRYQANEMQSQATMPGKRDRKPDGRFEPGDLIMGRYKVLAELGQGGMGVVYKCFDETAGIEIALKALPPELSHNSQEMEDIKENFQLVAKLVHQNIAISKNLERDNSNGNYYLIMECVEGEDLRRWIKRKRRDGSLTIEAILPVIRQIAEALDYAHEQKIIHRDIKPGNIMIDPAGNVKVLDFGLAAQIHSSMSHVSMAYHGTSGTGPYMAPEQWRGRAQGAAADQYALAVMTYEMLAGHLPFDVSDPAVLREVVLNEPPAPISECSDALNHALLRAMSKEPVDRFANCSDFVTALAGKKSTMSELGNSRKKHFIFIAVTIVAGLVLIAVLFGGPSAGTSLALTKQLSNMELYELQRELKSQSSRLVKLDRDNGFAIHIDEFEKYLKIGNDALSHNDFSTASDAFQRADREAKWLSKNETHRQEEARRQKEARLMKYLSHEDIVLNLPGNVKLALVKVKAGSFWMGSPENEKERHYFDYEKLHQVTLTNDFYIGNTEVTQAQYEAVMGKNPSSFQSPDRPVEQVSWNEAMAFCDRLNEITAGKRPQGYKFTLPTEAQWEYACRAGTDTAFCYGNSLSSDMANFNGNFPYRTEKGIYRKKTVSAGSFRPNAWGIYDMHGNVSEWCLDRHDGYGGAEIDPVGPSTGSFRVIRGGSWDGFARFCRSACRNYSVPGYRSNDLGFRLALVPDK